MMGLTGKVMVTVMVSWRGLGVGVELGMRDRRKAETFFVRSSISSPH